MTHPQNPWDSRYGQDGFYYGTEPNDFLVEQAGRIPSGGRVLCLAEGEGRNAVYLATKGFRVLAVDGSKVGIEKARKLASSRGVQIETQVADLSEFQFEPGSFDGVVSIWCHLPPPLRSEVHAQSIGALKKGGVLILEAYRPKQLEYKTGGPPVPELMMTREILAHDFAGLDPLVLLETDRMIHEGQGHEGLSAVVQFAGVKRG
jgi:SAM-dependent methyltransferase